MCLIEKIQLLHKSEKLPVDRVVQQVPAKLFFLVPFLKFCQLIAHEGELFAGMKIKVCIQTVQLVKLFFRSFPKACR